MTSPEYFFGYPSDGAQQKVNLPDLPVNLINKLHAIHPLLLLLASPSTHILCSYIGLSDNSLPLLFAYKCTGDQKKIARDPNTYKKAPTN
jgi:hypothetical protein